MSSEMVGEKRPAEEQPIEEPEAKVAKVEEPVAEAPVEAAVEAAVETPVEAEVVAEAPVEEPVAEVVAEVAAEAPVEADVEAKAVVEEKVEDVVAEAEVAVEEAMKAVEEAVEEKAAEEVVEEDEDEEELEQMTVEEAEEEGDDSFSAEDFPDLDLTPEQVEEYNTLYASFAEYCEKESAEKDGMCMVLKNAAEIRPLPKTVEEMKNSIPHVIVPHAQYDYKMLLEEKLGEAIEEEGLMGEEKYSAEVKEAGMEEGADLPEERAEQLGAEMHRNIAKISLDIINESMADSEQMLEKKEFKTAFFTCVVTTELIFAAREQICLVESEADGDRLEKTLLRLKNIWKKSMAASNEDLGMTEFYRGHVKSWLSWVHECLKNGEVIPDVSIEYFNILE